MHIHSQYSWDSRLDLDTIASTLAQNQISYGAIVDHVEFDREDVSSVIQKFQIRNLEIDCINEQYQGKLTLLKAVEISEPHRYPKEVARLSQDVAFDFIMGSIHHIIRDAESRYETEDAYYRYYKEVIEMIRANQIDVVGHLDYIHRYYDRDYSFYGQLSDIFSLLQEHDMILEMNTSAERRCHWNTFPSLEKLARYRLIRNEIIIGTDAHRENELVDNLEQAELITKELGFQPVIYQKRKRINL